MPDPLFAEPRLAELYDRLEGGRADLDHYVSLIQQLAARTVLDLGCGTGVLACRLAGLGVDVVGVDPAAASIDVARGKPSAERVRWLVGAIPEFVGPGRPIRPASIDLAVMTGNVAQVFLDDEEWSSTLAAIARALRPGGHLVYEARDPDARAWDDWIASPLRRELQTEAGPVQFRRDVTSVSMPFVSFRATFRFAADDVIESDSTLRFRSRREHLDTLDIAGFDVEDVRGAPDRPGLEFVFVARRRA